MHVFAFLAVVDVYASKTTNNKQPKQQFILCILPETFVCVVFKHFAFFLFLFGCVMFMFMCQWTCTSPHWNDWKKPTMQEKKNTNNNIEWGHTFMEREKKTHTGNGKFWTDCILNHRRTEIIIFKRGTFNHFLDGTVNNNFMDFYWYSLVKQSFFLLYLRESVV